MKDKFRKLCFLPVAVTLTTAAPAQTATPPVKMGLWKTTSTITTSGFELPPDVPRA